VPEKSRPLSEEQLRNWKVLDRFRKALRPRLSAAPKHPSESDPRRQLRAEEYFCLFVFRLFNPILTSMRGLCAATRFKKMRALCQTPVAPSSFSEGQYLFSPEILAQVVRDLAAQCHWAEPFGDAQLRAAVKALTIVDGTVLRAVPRMAWAPAAGAGQAVRLHLHFSVFEQVPTDWTLTPGNASELREWKKKLDPQAFYVGDRGYGMDLLWLKQLQKKGVSVVTRLRENVVRIPQGPPRPLSAEDLNAGVVSDRIEELGLLGGGPQMRIVQIVADGKTFVLATTRRDLPAHLIGLIYRYRWQIELYFKWLKAMLPCKHWLAESPEGVAIQVYSVLIASLLLLLWMGRRPTKREMEALWFYWTGFADEDELLAALKIQKNG
jgi:hypothetical protein